VKVTLEIDEPLLVEARVQAAAAHQPVELILAEAVRVGLSERNGMWSRDSIYAERIAGVVSRIEDAERRAAEKGLPL